MLLQTSQSNRTLPRVSISLCIVSVPCLVDTVIAKARAVDMEDMRSMSKMHRVLHNIATISRYGKIYTRSLHAAWSNDCVGACRLYDIFDMHLSPSVDL